MNNGNKIVTGIRIEQKNHHDTLYCHPNHKDAIARAISGGHGTIDNLQVAGLTVVAHDEFMQPIVCKKGELFPIAEDFK